MCVCIHLRDRTQILIYHLFVYCIYYAHKLEAVLNHTFRVPTQTMTATSVRSCTMFVLNNLKFWNIWDFWPVDAHAALTLPSMRNKTGWANPTLHKHSPLSLIGNRKAGYEYPVTQRRKTRSHRKEMPAGMAGAARVSSGNKCT